MSNYKWGVGMFFSSKVEFKEAITSYVVQNGRDLRSIKNDKVRVKFSIDNH